MNRNKLIFAAIVTLVFLIGGTILILEWLGPKRTIVIEVTGVAGSALTGEVDVDGERRTINEKLPAKLSYEARTVKFALIATNDGVRQQLQARVFVQGEEHMSASGTGARGEIYKPAILGMWWRQRYWITTQSEGKIGP
jgi:hypothetical protein